jgi:zinc protease
MKSLFEPAGARAAALCAALAASLLLPPMAGAQTAPAALAAVTAVEGITEYRLPNGLQLLLVPDASKPTTTVNVTYRVGSRHENHGETGMAHLLEHMLFKGTPTHPAPWSEFTKRGLRANGTTSFDRTNYFATFAANDETLDWYLGWQADAMTNSFVAKKDLDTEMTVVRNELETGESDPARQLLQRTVATMYEWHAYGRATIGARSDVENVDIARLQAFYRLHYQPDNATVIVAGRFDAARVLARVQAVFGPIPKPTRALAQAATLEPPQDGERSVALRRPGGVPLLVAGYHVMPGAHPDYAAVMLLARVLGDTPGGRLHRALVAQRKLATEAFAFSRALAEPGQLFAGVVLAPRQDAAAARAAMLAVLDAAAKAEPIRAEELERARRQWLNAWEQGHADPETVGVAISEAIALGDWRLYFLLRDRVRAVALADVQRVAAQWLKADNRTVASHRPTDAPDRAPAPARVDVAAMLQGFQGAAAAREAEAFDSTPAALDARTLLAQLGSSDGRSGVRLGLLPKATRGDAVQGLLALHWGDVATLANQGLAADMMGALFQMGTTATAGAPALSRQQLADRFDALQAQVGFSATGQTLYVGFQTVRQHLPALVALIGQVLRAPAFPAAELEEARGQWLAGIEAQRKEPGAIVGNAIERHVDPHPPGDPRHARSFDELSAAAKAMTRAQVVAYHRRFVSAAAGELAIVGAMDEAAARRAAEAAFGRWLVPAGAPRGGVAYRRIPRPEVASPPARLLFQTPGEANAQMRLSLTLRATDRDPDAAALRVGAFILGDGPGSRLWRRIREAEGLSYGVGAAIAWNEFEPNSKLGGDASFAPQNQAAVEAAWRDELARSVREGFTAAELAEAQRALLARRRLNRSQDDVLAAALAGNLYLGRRFADSQRVDDAIEAVTLEQLNAAWRKHVDPARAVWAWAGDFAAQGR